MPEKMASGRESGYLASNPAKGGKSYSARTCQLAVIAAAWTDAGSVSFIRGTRVGYLPQESEPAGNETVLEIAVPHEHEHDGQFVAKAKQILAGLSFRRRISTGPRAK